MILRTRKTTSPALLFGQLSLDLHTPGEVNDDLARVGLAGNSGSGVCIFTLVSDVKPFHTLRVEVAHSR